MKVKNFVKRNLKEVQVTEPLELLDNLTKRQEEILTKVLNATFSYAYTLGYEEGQKQGYNSAYYLAWEDFKIKYKSKIK